MTLELRKPITAGPGLCHQDYFALVLGICHVLMSFAGLSQWKADVHLWLKLARFKLAQHSAAKLADDFNLLVLWTGAQRAADDLQALHQDLQMIKLKYSSSLQLLHAEHGTALLALSALPCKVSCGELEHASRQQEMPKQA